MHTIYSIQQIRSNYFDHVLVVISQYLIGLINCALLSFSERLISDFVGCFQVVFHVFLWDVFQSIFLSFCCHSLFFFQKQFFN